MKIDKLITFIVILYMSMMLAPIIHMYINLGRFIGVNPLTPRNLIIAIQFLIFIKKPTVFLSKPLLLVYLYYVVFLVYSLSGYYDTKSQWFWQYHFPVYLSTLILTYYLTAEDYKGLASIMLASVIFIAFSTGLNIIQLQRYPGAVRSQFLTMRGGGDYSGLGDFYARIGVAGIALVSSIPLLIPVLFGIYKTSHDKKIRYFAIAVVILILISSYISAVMAPLLIAIVAVIVSYLGRRRLKASLAVLAMFLVFTVIIPKSFVANAFYYASVNVSNKDTSMKLKDIGLSLEEGIDVETPTTSVESRVERIPRNLEMFLTSPLIGTGYEENAHLFWLNYLAQFGMMGTLPLIFVLAGSFRKNLSRINEEFKFYYLISFVLFIALGLMKGYIGSMMYYTLFLVPGIYYIRYLQTGAPEKAIVSYPAVIKTDMRFNE